MKTVSRIAGATTLAVLLDLLIGMHLYGSSSDELIGEKRDYLIATMPFFIVLLNAIFYLMETNGDLRQELQTTKTKQDVAVVLDIAPDQYITTMKEYQTKIMNNENANENTMGLARYIHTFLFNNPDRVRDVVPFLIFLGSTNKIRGLSDLVVSLTAYLKEIGVGLERMERFKSEIVKRNTTFHDYVERARFDLR